MLTLEIIGILGALFAFLVYGMVRTQLARREAHAEKRTKEHATLAAGKRR